MFEYTKPLILIAGGSLLAAAFAAVLIVIQSIRHKPIKLWLIILVVFATISGLFYLLGLSSIFSIYYKTSAF